ncbi:DUF5615 family PIN-like protein [Leptospira saintgironsiae]|uniref:Toxin-antitoxin system, toxin component, PIN family protein n=1 Tax=Leptospira saintgironsiae TaxID=2023183 RepID=A0A2M9YBI8_9LEPT|nr:DUF5615 family PIN-like protein [Leptospira saintgironsiae]PJZ48921.1 toxin-antitoxin system, toxin component, PIN family protein [Leptospira saintgironsiae]
MKVLLDTCVWGGVLKELLLSGIDVIWVGDFQSDPGDEEILTLAFEQKRILITLDKDFGELAVVRKIPHHGIVRLVNLSTSEQVRISKYILGLHEKELFSGAIITASADKLRLRLPDLS